MSLLGQYVAVVLLNLAERTQSEKLGGSASSLAKKVARLTYIAFEEEDVAEAIEILERFGAADKDYNPLSGGFWEIDYDNFRYYFIEKSPEPEDDETVYAELSALTDRYPVLQAFARRGVSYAEDVIANLRSLDTLQWDELRNSQGRAPQEAPGSDRVVTFKHNQIVELDEQTTEIIDAVQGLNQIDETPGLREIILGQLKAGREIIREGTFRLYVLEITLVEGLKFLAKRYERETVGALAAVLLTALAAKLGITV